MVTQLGILILKILKKLFLSAVLQGIPNGSAHLCKAFYSLQEAFTCAKMTMNDFCLSNKTLMTEFNSLLEMASF